MPTPVTERGNQPAAAIKWPSMCLYGCYDSTTTVIRHFRSTANSRIAVGKICGFENNSFTRQNSPDSKVFGFKVPTLISRFKISEDTTKPGIFEFGFGHLRKRQNQSGTKTLRIHHESRTTSFSVIKPSIKARKRGWRNLKSQNKKYSFFS